jgi:alpha-tubulin suppressor-like RCC1 family protein
VGEAKMLSQASGVRDVAVVSYGLCLVLDDGSMKCTDERTPVGTRVVHVDDTCIVHDDGSASCHGYNENGELGDGGLMLSATPKQVPGIADVVDLQVAHGSACAVRRNGILTCWGEGSIVDLGKTSGPLIPAQYVAGCRIDGTSLRCSTPNLGGTWESESVPTKATSIKTAAIHRDTSICVVEGGKVTCRHGMSEGGVDERWVPLPAPAPVEDLQPLSVGFCARHTDGRVSCFVDHRYDNDDDFLESLPKGQLSLVTGIKDAKQLVTGQNHACVLTKAAAVWCWDTDRPKMAPYEMTTLRGATSLGANHRHTCAVVKGEVWCWGYNFHGQVGDGTASGRIEPVKTPVRAAASFKAVEVGTGRDSTCALDDKGNVWCWGSNQRGALGQPRKLRGDTLSKVVGLGPRP